MHSWAKARTGGGHGDARGCIVCVFAGSGKEGETRVLTRHASDGREAASVFDARLEWMLREACGTMIADTRCVVHTAIMHDGEFVYVVSLEACR